VARLQQTIKNLPVRVLPVRYLYRQFSIMFQTVIINNKQNSKRQNGTYDMYVRYTRKSIGNKFLDYLGPINFNAMPLYLKKYTFNNVKKSNNYKTNKKAIVHCLLLEL